MKLPALAILIISLIVPAMATAYPPGGKGMHHKRDGLAQLLSLGKEHRSGVFFLMRHLDLARKHLNLTDAQITRFQKIGITFRSQFLDVKKKLVPEKLELQKLLLAEKMNLKKVRSQLDKIAKHLVDIQMLKIRHRLTMEAVLTKAQRARLRQLVNERKMRGPRFGRPMRPGE